MKGGIWGVEGTEECQAESKRDLLNEYGAPAHGHNRVDCVYSAAKKTDRTVATSITGQILTFETDKIITMFLFFYEPMMPRIYSSERF